MNRGLAALAICCLLAAPLSACGSEGSSGSSSPTKDNPYAATEQPTFDVEMIDAPADYHAIEGNGFTISAPGEFQERHATGSNGEPILGLEKPSAVNQVPQTVTVIRDVEPKQDATEQSFALETQMLAGAPDSGEVHRYQLDAPDGQQAYLVTWVAQQATRGSGSVEVTYWQLMHQVSEELILNVVAFAPTAEFETSEVSRILRTFEPSSSA
jgi:hypothetical protein